MAIFGFQLCFTIIMASFLQKLTPIYSLGRWILCGGGLYRFVHPTNEELKKLAGKESSDKRSKKDVKNSTKKRHQPYKRSSEKTNNTTKEVFKIPKNVDIPLDTTNITVLDALVLRKYDEYEWLVDYGLYATIVYCGTEIYYEWWKPDPEFNISMVWSLLAIGFVCKNLFSIMKLYFKSESGELSTCITFGCFSFVASMAVLVVDEQTLEFGLDSAYNAFAQNASLLTIGATVYPSPAPAPLPLPIIKIGVAFLSGIIGTLLAFPGIRTAQMYVDGLKYSRGNQLIQLLLHINFATPFLISFMWVRPLARDVLCGSNDIESVRKPFLTDHQFDIARLIIIVSLCFLKILAFRTHLQAYLNVACIKIRNLRREAGQTTNTDIQKTVARVFFYLCVVALQYIGPVMAVLFLTMCLKTMGGYSWQQIKSDYVLNSTYASFSPSHANVLDEGATFSEMVSHAGVSLARMSAVFTPMVFRSIFSFLIWWLCTSWFIASCLGIVYHRFLSI
ncbi:transmembrane protein 161B-like [Styela clava]